MIKKELPPEDIAAYLANGFKNLQHKMPDDVRLLVEDYKKLTEDLIKRNK